MTFSMRVLAITLLSSISLLLAINGSLSISGYTGNSVILKLWNASFTPVTGTTDYQIKIIVNYSLANSSLVGQKINAVMKVHGASGDVVKTSSFSNGFSANNNGTTQLLTKFILLPWTNPVWFLTRLLPSLILKILLPSNLCQQLLTLRKLRIEGRMDGIRTWIDSNGPTHLFLLMTPEWRIDNTLSYKMVDQLCDEDIWFMMLRLKANIIAKNVTEFIRQE